jgi:uncharacterized protein (TIGR00255 family)
MTGFGVGEAPLGPTRLVVEMRAFNHRFLDVRVRMQAELGDLAALAEDVVRRQLDRGRIEVAARIDGEALVAPKLDVARARAAFAELCTLRDELRPGEPVPLSLLASVPDLFASRWVPPAEEAREALAAAAERAIAALSEMRAREGTALAADMRARLDTICRRVSDLRERAPSLVDQQRRRLEERIERLLREGAVPVDPARLEQEVVFYADRVDVTEELTRLSSHCAQFRELMAGDERAIGRRLDFLLQEMNREANTIGSKIADVDVARQVVEVKAELERLREQVQNVE